MQKCQTSRWGSEEECKPINLLDGGSEEECKPANLLDWGSEELLTCQSSR